MKIATLPDFLQHAKMEKEGLVHDISVYLGRQRGGGVPDRKNELEAFLVVSVPSAGVSNAC